MKYDDEQIAFEMRRDFILKKFATAVTVDFQ